MNDQAAGKVEGAELGQEAAAPDPVGHGIINKERPNKDEGDKGMKLHAFGKGAGNQGRRDDGKHALEGDEGQFRNRSVVEDGHADTGKAYFIKRPDETVNVGTEGHGIADENPFDGNHGDDEEALHNRCQYVFIADHAAVEEAQSRCHEKYQGRTDEHPGGIAWIYRSRGRRKNGRRCCEKTRQQDR